jgi:hypothetical protein
MWKKKHGILYTYFHIISSIRSEQIHQPVDFPAVQKDEIRDEYKCSASKIATVFLDQCWNSCVF